MYNVTRVVHAANGAGADEWTDAVKNIAAVAESSNALRRLVCTTLPGVINGGDLIVHLQFEDEMAWQTARDAVDDSLRCAAVDHFHGAEYSSGTTGRSGADAAGQVYRALFIRVSPGTPQDVLEEFERDLLRMPTISRRSAPGVSAESTQRSGTHHGLMSGSRSSPTSAHCRPSTSIIRFTGQWWTGGSTPNVPRPWSTTESVTRSAISPRDS